MALSSLRRSDAFRDGKWLLWASGAIMIAILASKIVELFDGTLASLDDMARLQQVRDLIGGQAWFVVDQSRLLTPEGGEMHWSRLPDLFMAGFIVIMQPLIGQSAAEALAVGIWPLTLLSAALILLCTIMQRLEINIAGQLIAFLFFIGSAAVYNFWPGRIDHHGFVALLLLGGLAALLSKQQTARSGIILAFCVCASLTIAIEGLPYIVGLIAAAGLFWLVRGHREGVRLASMGLALMAFSTFFLIFDAPGWGPRRMVCDAYGWSHWAALLSGGGLLALLGIFGGWLETWQKRTLAAVIAGGITLAIFVAANPACLGDPYADVPETVRQSWLSAVAEAQSLPALLGEENNRVIWVFGFLVTTSLATIWMILNASPEQRLPCISVALLLALGIATTIWQIRGQSFSHLFGLFGAAWLSGVMFSKWQKQRGVVPLLMFAGATLLLTPTAWRSFGYSLYPASANHEDADTLSADCILPENYRHLASGPLKRVHTPIDLGMPILARTPHSVFVGPYHRNVLGIERANSVLIGDPDDAQQKLLDMGATHLAYCRRLGETERYERIWPNSFAAQLNANEFPDWLEPADDLTETDGVIRLYRVKSK
ncbi:MAG: hypothetical protein AAGJ68_04010 [Pseudomonadota bacterium]